MAHSYIMSGTPDAMHEKHACANDWAYALNDMCHRIVDDVKEGARKSYPSVLSYYPIVKVRLQSTGDGGQQDTTIALVLNDVSCFTANVTLCSNTNRPQKQVDEIVRALAQPDAKSACASATGSTGWSVAHGTALYQSLLACEKFELEVDTVSYSVRCDVRIRCFTSTGTTSNKPCCQFYEYLIDSGISRAIIGTAISKCGGVRAGLELRVFSSDKTLLGVQGSISFVFSDTNSGHKSLCNAFSIPDDCAMKDIEIAKNFSSKSSQLSAKRLEILTHMLMDSSISRTQKSSYYNVVASQASLPISKSDI
jgi:hypothetical protein